MGPSQVMVRRHLVTSRHTATPEVSQSHSTKGSESHRQPSHGSKRSSSHSQPSHTDSPVTQAAQSHRQPSHTGSPVTQTAQSHRQPSHTGSQVTAANGAVHTDSQVTAAKGAVHTGSHTMRNVCWSGSRRAFSDTTQTSEKTTFLTRREFKCR